MACQLLRWHPTNSQKRNVLQPVQCPSLQTHKHPAGAWLDSSLTILLGIEEKGSSHCFPPFIGWGGRPPDVHSFRGAPGGRQQMAIKFVFYNRHLNIDVATDFGGKRTTRTRWRTYWALQMTVDAKKCPSQRKFLAWYWYFLEGFERGPDFGRKVSRKVELPLADDPCLLLMSAGRIWWFGKGQWAEIMEKNMLMTVVHFITHPLRQLT